jgi:hypothetical protein
MIQYWLFTSDPDSSDAYAFGYASATTCPSQVLEWYLYEFDEVLCILTHMQLF